MGTPPQLPPVDEGNPLVSETQCLLTTALANTPNGQRLGLTIRTPSATLTVLLDGPTARKWGKQITDEASQMSGSGLIVAQSRVAPPNGSGGG